MGDFAYGGDYLARVYGPGARDQRLESFGQGRWSDRGIPSVWLAVEAAEVSRPEVLADATADELLGVGRAWKSLEGWAFCGKLEVVRELIRRYPLAEDGEHGEPGEAAGPPDGWDRRLHHEIGAALGISVVAAGKLAELAWALDNRLPGIRQALEEGRVDPGRARMIADETSVLDREDLCRRAEEVILGGLARCRTWADLLRLVQRAVIMADPDGARKRRERAEREEARLRFWREASGTCGLQGTGLPADEALAARAHIEARAQAYKAAGIRRPVEMLRIMALADILNGVPAGQRISQARAEDQARAAGAGEAAGADEQAARDARLRDAARQAKAKFRDKTRDNPSGKTGNEARDKASGKTGDKAGNEPRNEARDKAGDDAAGTASGTAGHNARPEGTPGADDTASPEGTASAEGTASPDDTASADDTAGADDTPGTAGRDAAPGDPDGGDPFDGGPGGHDDGPGDDGPADDGPGDGDPSDDGPAGGACHDGPGDGGPDDGGPDHGGPGDSSPGDSGPEDSGPEDSGLADGGPGDGDPGDSGPGGGLGGGLVDGGPGCGGPGYGRAGDDGPGDGDRWDGGPGGSREDGHIGGSGGAAARRSARKPG